MPNVVKEAGYENHFLPGELAQYLGVTTRTVRRWMHRSDFPKPSIRNDKGYKLWSPTDVKAVLKWRLQNVPLAKPPKG